MFVLYKWPGMRSACRNNNPVLSSLMIFQLIYNKSHTTGATGGEGTADPSGAIEFTPDI